MADEAASGNKFTQWWKERTRKQKILIIVIICLILLILLIAIICATTIKSGSRKQDNVATTNLPNPNSAASNEQPHPATTDSNPATSTVGGPTTASHSTSKDPDVEFFRAPTSPVYPDVETHIEPYRKARFMIRGNLTVKAITTERSTPKRHIKSTFPTDEPPTTRMRPRGTKIKQICETSECQRAALYYLSNMNASVDPCANFYQYVCGGWMAKNEIPTDQNKWGAFPAMREDVKNKCIALLETPQITFFPDTAVDMARSFFQGCLDTENASDGKGVTELRSLVLQYSESFRLLRNQQQVKDEIEWPVQLGRIARDLHEHYIFDFRVAYDVKNNSQAVIYLDQPTFGLPREQLINKEKMGSQKRIAAYKKYIVKSLCLILHSCTGGNRQSMEKDASKVLDFETRLAKFAVAKESRRVVSNWYRKKTLGQVAKLIPQIPWRKYLNEIFMAVDKDVDNKTVIILKGEKYFLKAANFLQNSEPRTVTLYILWRLLQTFGPLFSKTFRQYHYEFMQVTSGLMKAPTVGSRCFLLTNELLGYAVGQLYVLRHFSKNAKSDMDVMVTNLMGAMKELLEKNAWMDGQTKIGAKKKLTKMGSNIGFPIWILNDTELNDYYQEVTRVSRDDFLASVIDLKSFKTRKELLKLIVLPDHNHDWVTVPSVVNAMYLPAKNTITFPAGILQPPFYQHNTLNSLNYGAIGFVIGHEITHGFDDKGRQYDDEGNIRNWWGNKTMQEFNIRKQCLVNLYSRTKDEQTGLYVDGKNTVGENIADNGGIREAFQAFLKTNSPDVRLPGLEHLTQEQLFFISNGNVHCSKYRTAALKSQIQTNVHSPTMYRLILPLSNDKEFAKAFHCKPGTKMNPRKKCVLW